MSAYTGGDPLVAVYIGETPVVAVYVGGTQVWSAEPAGPLYSDDFNRADHPDLGDDWTDIAGTMKIAGNRARATDDFVQSQSLYASPMATDDHTVSVICGPIGSLLYLVLRAEAGGADKVLATMSHNGSWFIQGWVEGDTAWDGTAPGDHTWAEGDEVSFEVEGDLYVLKNNGSVIYSMTGGDYPTGSDHRFVGIGQLTFGGAAGIDSFAADDL